MPPTVQPCAPPALTCSYNISSVRVPAGWKVSLFTDPGLQGRSLFLTADLARLDGEFDDKVSSIKVERKN
ncbi:hypothetical protein ACWD64_35395 [Streptomyces antibioticus]|uniref:hypothetical protein n=1 Tax=Streptomyces antibioticus TaxID=1890 RepID=UPI000A5CFB8D